MFVLINTLKEIINLANTTFGCSLISSYFMNKILSGDSKLALQYDRTCCQYGPYSETPWQNSSNASPNNKGVKSFDLSLLMNIHLEINTSFGSL
ncbi:hypothetical protein Hanom_Chr02g00125201 [Helianthus anomalus]